MAALIVVGILLSLVSHVLDQGTDVFAVVLFYFEQNYWASILTFGYDLVYNILNLTNIIYMIQVKQIYLIKFVS